MPKTLTITVPAENVKEVEIKGNKMCQVDVGYSAEKFLEILSTYIASDKELLAVMDDEEAAIDKERSRWLAKLSHEWAKDG